MSTQISFMNSFHLHRSLDVRNNRRNKKKLSRASLRKHRKKNKNRNTHCGQNPPLSSITASLTFNYTVTRRRQVISASTLEKKNFKAMRSKKERQDFKSTFLKCSKPWCEQFSTGMWKAWKPSHQPFTALSAGLLFKSDAHAPPDTETYSTFPGTFNVAKQGNNG